MNTPKVKLFTISLLLLSGTVLGGTVHEVVPTGDVTLDGENIKAAIAAAEKGDTILLKAGRFVLGQPDSPITVPLPDGNSAIMSGWGILQGFVAGPTQLILIDKKLTLRGEKDSTGNPAAILDVELPVEYGALAWSGDPGFDGADMYLFVIGAPDVTIRDLEFRGSKANVITFWAGTDIRKCVFRGVGIGPVFFADERSVYPNYPDNCRRAKRSTFAGNRFVDAQMGIFVNCSEVVVKNNSFGLYGRRGVEVASVSDTWPLALQPFASMVRETVRNVLIRNNTFTGGVDFRIALLSRLGGPVENTMIVGNTFDSPDGAGIWLWANDIRAESENTTVTDTVIFGNTFRVGGYGLRINAENTVVIGNEIVAAERAVWISGIYEGWYAHRYAAATGNLVAFNKLEGTTGVYLGPHAIRNSVGPNWIDSDLQDYYLSAGEAVLSPANGNLVIAGRASVVDDSGMGSTYPAPQIDNDWDGLFSEDPIDNLNNDGDIIGGKHLIDEDPEELPNLIVAR